ncbi:hypothetical protein I4U23_006292 [Adineta vaga]|nr:hypothetical protein I4U23_006292 [Adineta vaga]
MSSSCNCVPPFSNQSRQRYSIVCPLIRLKIFNKRSYRSEMFRLFYERGDLPCAIEHIAKGQKLKWFIDNLEMLNLDYYLPIFTDGLCESTYPYSFIAFQGILDLITRASHKIDDETLAKLIRPLKHALYTHNPIIIRRVLHVLQQLARGNDGALGIILVSNFNQLLPIINIIKERNQSKYRRKQTECHLIDDFERNTEIDLVRLIDETLLVLEEFGGQDAFINIKYSIPTYEQQIDVKQLSSAQMNTIVQPFMKF